MAIIAHITDTHLDDPTATGQGVNTQQNLMAVLADAIAQGATEISFTGDTGRDGTYAWLMEQFAATGLPYRVILGNHDNAAETPANERLFPNPKYFSYAREGYKYIFLDSSAAEVDTEQYRWLQKELDTDNKIIAFIHHPVLGLGSAMDRIYPLHGRDAINELLQQCTRPVTVFCGHYHTIDTRTVGSVTQYLTPSVAFGVKKDAPGITITTDYFGYRMISITESGIETYLRINRYEGFVTEK